MHLHTCIHAYGCALHFRRLRSAREFFVGLHKFREETAKGTSRLAKQLATARAQLDECKRDRSKVAGAGGRLRGRGRGPGESALCLVSLLFGVFAHRNNLHSKAVRGVARSPESRGRSCAIVTGRSAGCVGAQGPLQGQEPLHAERARGSETKMVPVPTQGWKPKSVWAPTKKLRMPAAYRTGVASTMGPVWVWPPFSSSKDAQTEWKWWAWDWRDDRAGPFGAQ